MTFTDDFWREIPNAIVDQDQRQRDADAWATQQRAQLANEWATAQRADIAQQYGNDIGYWRSATDSDTPLPDETLTWQALQRRHQTEIADTHAVDPVYRPQIAANPDQPDQGWQLWDRFRPAEQSAKLQSVSGDYSQPDLSRVGSWAQPASAAGAGPETAFSSSPNPTPSPLNASVAPAPSLTDLNARPVGTVTADRRSLTDVSQFGQSGLSYDEALAACGPAAAVRLASVFGNNIPLKAALDAAKQVGWTSAGGMNGITNEKRLLDSLGIPAVLDTSPDPGKIISDAQSGNPVTISTPNHYFTASGYDPKTGRLFVGESGKVYRGGGEWLTLDQIRRLGGGLNGALFVDAPTSPQPSVAALETGQTEAYQPAAPGRTTSVPPSRSPIGFDGLVSQARDAVTTALQPVGDTIGGAVETAQQIPQKAGQAFGDVVSAARSAVGYTPETDAVSVPGFGFDPSSMQPGVLPESGLPLKRDVRDTVQELQPTIFDRAGQALASNQANSPLAPLGQALAGSPIGQAYQSDVRRELLPNITDPNHPFNVMADLREKYGTSLPSDRMTPEDRQRAENAGLFVGGMAGTLTTAISPLLQRTSQMLQAKPPVADEGSMVQKFVRAWTNRNETLDRYQEETLRGAGLDVLNPPQRVDAAALVREIAADAPTKIRIDRELKPAVQAVGQDQDALSALLMHRNNVDVAAALNTPNRTFPGNFTAADSQQAILDLEQHLGPQRWQTVSRSAQQVNQFVDNLRTRMVDSGLIPQQFASDLKAKYPNWVPTRVLDYIDDPAARAGRRLSIGDAGLKKYTLEGTERFAEDPLASLMGLAQQVETKARKNEVVNALVELDQLRGASALLKPLKGNAPIRTEETISRIVNGQVEKYIAPPPLAAVINGPQITNAPGFVRAWTNFQRAVATVVNPAFALVRNPSLDVPEYLTRELARAGGNPLALPRIVSELGRGYAEALFSPAAVRSLLRGEFQGEAARYLERAGGSGGLVESSADRFAARQQAVRTLSRSNALEVHSAGDLARLLKDVLTLRPVAAVAERTELGPRIASMRLAERQGYTPVRAALRGRQVTMDFNEGGTFAKTVNQFIPFFNAGLQGTAQIPRMFRENKAGTAGAMTMLVGLPAVAAEAWNHADPQRAQDYADVPQYLKNQGVVVMLPGEAAADAQGNRKPGFVWLNMRGFAPFASIARDAYNRVAGNDPQQAQELAMAIGTGISPIRANTVADVPSALLPNIGGMSTGTELAFNKDFFRGRDIATLRNDESASETARRIAQNVTAVAQLVNPRAEVRPSQVEFAVKDLLGGVGALGLGAGDLAMGASKPGDTPVISGLARAAGGRTDTGETFRDVREPSQRLPDEILRVIQAGGVRYEPQPVRDTVLGVKLTQAEQTRFQQITNQHVKEILSDLADYGPWKNGDPESRDKLLGKLVDRARQNAQREFLNSIPDAEWNRRKRAS